MHLYVPRVLARKSVRFLPIQNPLKNAKPLSGLLDEFDLCEVWPIDGMQLWFKLDIAQPT